METGHALSEGRGENTDHMRRRFSLRYEQFKQFSKDVVFRRSPNHQPHSAPDFYEHNQFAKEEDSDLTDWVIVKKSEYSTSDKTSIEGFLSCHFAPISSKRNLKFIKHWVALDADTLRCYQSKDSGYQLRFKKFNLHGATIVNGQSYTGRKYSFRVSAVGEVVPSYFLAEDEAEYKYWFDAIETIILQNKQSGENFSWTSPHAPPSPLPYETYNSSRLPPTDIAFEKQWEEAFLHSDADDQIKLSDMEMQWLDQSLDKHLSKHPECARTIICDHVEMILNCVGHPLQRYYSTAMTMWKDEHYFMVYTITDEDVLRSSVVVVKKIIQRVVKQLMSYYPNLEAFPKSHSYCTSSVEVVLFADLYEQIFSMYKFHYKREDSMYTKQIQEFSSITPAHFGVPERLWLLNSATFQMPYEAAVDAFKRIRECKTPLNKAKCLVDTGSAICGCVSQDQSEPGGQPITIGGDDLLPLFTYVVIRSQIPCTYSEFRFIEDFLDTQSCQGEMSYFLVTYCTSLALISCLTEETLGSWMNGDDLKAEDNSALSVSCPAVMPPDNLKKKKRGRCTSLIEVDLHSHEERSEEEPSDDFDPDSSTDFLSWASSLIRK